MDYWHIYPTGDLVEHDTESQGDCICNPTLELDLENDVCYVVHDSLDRRECFE